MFERPRSGERALLVRIGLGGPPGKDELSEFEALARSAGAEVLAIITGTRKVPDSRLYIGSGKAEEIHARVKELGADLVVFDHRFVAEPGTQSREAVRNVESWIALDSF